MSSKAIKRFEIREYSTSNMHYRIEVLFGGKVIETFERPTMQQAQNAVDSAGYVRVIDDEPAS